MSKAIKIGIIGGTGLDNPDQGFIENRKVTVVSTNYGSVELTEGKILGVDCVRIF
jgi:purine nucleoside phosphorylase